jgi:hypothetical protein
MCGGFPAMVSHLAPRPTAAAIRLGWYGLGKTLSYALLGAAAGGGALLALRLAAPQSALSLVLGGALVVAGVVYILVVGQGWAGPGLARFAARLGNVLRRAVERSGATGAFGVGVANGLLPCPLVYAMLLQAGAAGSPLAGAGTMALFGVGTLPALYGVAWAGHFLSKRWRPYLERMAGLVLVGLGAVTMLRGMAGQP